MSQSTPRKLSPTAKMTLLVVPLVVIIAGWAFWQQLQQGDTRQAGIPLSPYGVVTVQLTTDPFPAVPTGTVQMTLRLQAPGGRAAQVDRVTYTYGPENGDEEFEGQAELVAMDTYQGPLQFTGVGDWWLTVRLEYQGAAGEAQFTVPVKPPL